MCIGTAGMRAQQRHGDAADDVLQYAPYAAVFAMKACGVESRHDWAGLTARTAMSFVVSAGTTYILKNSVSERRPDRSDRRSFPSGHATIAFSGATVLHHEFGRVSPWISVGGYTVAALTAADRVRRDRHYWHDVAAGAAIGVAGTELSYFLADRLLPRLFPGRDVCIGFTGTGLDVAVRF